MKLKKMKKNWVLHLRTTQIILPNKKLKIQGKIAEKYWMYKQKRTKN